MIFSHSRNAYIAKGKKILKVKDPVFKLLAISAFKLLAISGTYRTAKRYCDLMVETGALEYTETGSIVITEKGNETSDFFFKALFEMPSLAEKMSLSEDVLIEGNRQAITLINKTLNGAEAGE